MSVFDGIVLDEMIKPGVLDYKRMVDRMMDCFGDEIERLGGSDVPLPGGGSIRVIESERLGPHEFRLVCGCAMGPAEHFVFRLTDDG